MLGQQYFTNPEFLPYLKNNFILMTLSLEDSLGKTVADKYRINSFPATLMLSADGSLFDILGGYGNRPDQYHTRVLASLEQNRNYAAYLKAYQDDRENWQAAFQLSRKLVGIYFIDEAETVLKSMAQAAARNPKLTVELDGRDLTLAEAADFGLGQVALFGGYKSGPLLDFVAHYPQSSLKQKADEALGWAFSRRPKHRDAAAFFDRIRLEYPDHAALLERSIGHAAATGAGLKASAELLPRLLDRWPDNEDLRKSGADVCLKLDQPQKAIEIYGPVFHAAHKGEAGTLNSYAWFWAERAVNLPDAEQAAKRSLALENQANTWDTLSMVYWKMKQYEKAIEAEEAAIELSDHPDYHKRIEAIKADMK